MVCPSLWRDFAELWMLDGKNLTRNFYAERVIALRLWEIQHGQQDFP